MDFLTSPRFYAMILGSASTVLVTSFGTEPWHISLGKFLALVSAGFITIATIDKNVGQANIKVAELAGNSTTVSMPSNVTNVTTSTENNG